MQKDSSHLMVARLSSALEQWQSCLFKEGEGVNKHLL